MVTVGFTPLVKEPGPECDYISPYRAKVTNNSFCTFTPPCAPVACTGTVLLYTFVFIRNVDLREAHISGLCVEFVKLVRLLIYPLKAELNPICHLLALLGAHHIIHVSRIRVKKITSQITSP
jgi:hypothetical protein